MKELIEELQKYVYKANYSGGELIYLTTVTPTNIKIILKATDGRYKQTEIILCDVFGEFYHSFIDGNILSEFSTMSTSTYLIKRLRGSLNHGYIED